MEVNALNGILLMCGASIAFCFMSGLIRAAENINPLKMVFFRFIIGFSLLGTAAIFNKIKLNVSRSPLLFLRGVIGGLAVFIFYLSIHKLGVGKGTVFTYSYPIFASIFSALFLREKISMVKWFYIVLAFGGIYVLASAKENNSSLFLSISLYEFIGILGAILAGISVVLIKKLHDSENSYVIFYSQCLFGFWIFVIPANVVPSIGGLTEIFMLLSIGIVAASGQLLMTEGYRYVKVTTGSLLNMVVPVLNFVVAIIIFKETYSYAEIIGSIIVIISCILVISQDGFLKPLSKSR